MRNRIRRSVVKSGDGNFALMVGGGPELPGWTPFAAHNVLKVRIINADKISLRI
jgi:hypothetical protein